METKLKLFFLVIAASAIFTISVNELVLAEPEEWQESNNGILDFPITVNKNNNNTEDQNLSMTKITAQNITLSSGGGNISRILELQINFTNDKFDLDKLRDEGFYIRLHIKSDHYSDYMKFPISDHLVEDPILLIPIRNNSTDYDDGGDFRIDVSINQFDKKFLKATYPIKRNATFDSVNIDEILEYVINDEKEEGNYSDNEEDNNSELSLEYSIILDRPILDGDIRPHAKIKDPINENN